MPPDRRVPRYTADPPVSDTIERLTSLRKQIDEQLDNMKFLEEKLMPHDAYDSINDGKLYPGATVERAQAARSIGRISAQNQQKNALSPETQPAFTSPAARVAMAEADLQKALSRLLEITERTVGSAASESPEFTEDPIPWGGTAGEIACAAERMRRMTRRMHDLMGAMETALP